jgi:hypothetical protein
VTFAFATAWLIALLVAGPLLAHLMRRGRAREIPFAPTALVLAGEHVARHPSRIDNRRLLLVRMGVVLGLALLGSSPLVRCEEPVLRRHAGGSVALAFVLDDSASMRTRMSDGRSRFETARQAALSLLPQLRSDDTVAIVLAGTPARMALLPTRSARLARRILLNLRPSDRSTDVEAALVLGRAALSAIPTAQRRLVALTDQATPPELEGQQLWVPVPSLTLAAADCGVVLARRLYPGTIVELACSPTVTGGRKRRLELFSQSDEGRVVEVGSFVEKPGRSSVVLETTPGGAAIEKSLRSPQLGVRLLGEDANPDNDTASLCRGELGLGVMVVSDPATSRPPTGGPSLLEQALASLDEGLTIRPLVTAPSDEASLDDTDLLLLDDPQPLPPSTRSVMGSFVARGGVAVAFLGPNAASQQLVSLLSPFVEGRTVWQGSAPAGLDIGSVSWLGPSKDSLASLGAKARVLFDDAVDSRGRVAGRWSDGRAWLLERPLQSGKVYAVGLPLSLAHSEFTLRPGFLALLSHLIAESKERGRSRVVVAGQTWRFFGEEPVSVMGPTSPVELVESRDAEGRLQQSAVPSEAGRYQIAVGGRVEERFAIVSASEILKSSTAAAQSVSAAPQQESHPMDISRFAAMGLLAMAALELFTSALGRRVGVWLRQFRRRGQGKSGLPDSP